MKCPFCGFESNDLSDFDEDFINKSGYWCPDCDGFISERNQQFILYKEDKSKVLYVKKTDIKKQVSPLRYPGGKSRMIDFLEPIIKKDIIVEPFAGGASVSLAFLLSGKVKQIILNDIDFGWYSLFFRILNDTEGLCKEISNYRPSKADYKVKQQYIFSGYGDLDIKKSSMAFLIVNRCAFSGIPYANCKSNITERWNPVTLCKRIRDIAKFKNKIVIYNKSAEEIIEEYYWNDNVLLFIDPPYIGKGDMLYVNKYDCKKHIQLAYLLEDLYKSCPCADIVITYDDVEMLDGLYIDADIEKIGTRYSLSRRETI